MVKSQEIPIATKWRIELVQTNTSTLIQKSHNSTLNVHAPVIVDQAPNGVTIKPTCKLRKSKCKLSLGTNTARIIRVNNDPIKLNC